MKDVFMFETVMAAIIASSPSAGRAVFFNFSL